MDEVYGEEELMLEILAQVFTDVSKEMLSTYKSAFPKCFDTQHITSHIDGVSERDMSSGNASNFPGFFRENNEIVQENKQALLEIENGDNELYSTHVERINQTPKEDTDRGKWDGVRGDSNFKPSDTETLNILDKYEVNNISYKDGIPDFSVCSESTVKIDNMTEMRSENFKQCDDKCAREWNASGRDGRTDWSAAEVKAWRRENDYSWHERNDMKNCDLVPTKVNDYFGHLGGVAECKKRNGNVIGGDFDD